jgi:hypothetical protein
MDGYVTVRLSRKVVARLRAAQREIEREWEEGRYRWMGRGRPTLSDTVGFMLRKLERELIESRRVKADPVSREIVKDSGPQ